ncbi:MAG: bifunctional UDP-N-acetylmuramoyl-tripeptide:D-alanyl-D-alanine ligase/alanine racemase, partial [Chitinophagaceae bacterium]|nr:bifunctional UDP-N-acetylmuramoyl-tripeptide:D-alanyl-D-alanine ligase/alanine racemase [Chitinophagaceae bacterium]
MYSINQICEHIGGMFLQQNDDSIIRHLVFDSRRIQFPEESLFFSIVTEHRDGHAYTADAHQKGIRNFIVQKRIDHSNLPDSNVILVKNTLHALQQFAAFHRMNFKIPVIGITGSNGKTIVKEWLFQLLNEDYNIVRSPKSYNSQIGVPLSVWQMNDQHTLAIFEAGISRPGEMEKLQNIIQPNIGVFTNIGEAHDEGFESHEQKLREKLKLFQHADVLICEDKFRQYIAPPTQFFSWGRSKKATLSISTIEKKITSSVITAQHRDTELELHIPFTDDASIQNAISCWCVMLNLGYDQQIINRRFSKLHAIEMRLKLMTGINNCTIINDSYSADQSSLRIALDFLVQQQFTNKKTVILSDFIESGRTDEELYSAIAADLKWHGVQKIVTIGETITRHLPVLLHGTNVVVEAYSTTGDFIRNFRSSAFKDETILVKGARKFEFERIISLFEQRVHQTLLEINLNSIVHNLKEYRKILKQQTKIMAMVKAFAYGSGIVEIAGILQFHNVDYLGVAYADEGVDLRKAGITVPIMVMNADESSFQAITEYNLQPVIYSFELLRQFQTYLNEQALQHYPVHVEIETGMNRLGFLIDEIPRLLKEMNTSNIKIESVFTHLAASDEPSQDGFTLHQAELFQDAVHQLKKGLPYHFLKHIGNSAAAIRFPDLQLDMVRLGIGLYGIETVARKLDLQPVATLKSTIAQVKRLRAGETVSYNRKGVVKKDSVIA